MPGKLFLAIVWVHPRAFAVTDKRALGLIAAVMPRHDGFKHWAAVGWFSQVG
jgi:hypothetical protein